jgi:hypothetical protein
MTERNRARLSTAHGLRVAGLVAAGLILGGGIVIAGTVLATFVEDFEDGRNEGAWTYGTGNEFVTTDGGGNPGRYLRDNNVVSFHPKASTSFGDDSIFTGNWRREDVVAIGIDLATVDASQDVSNRKLSVILLNDNRTPDDLDDDWGALLLTDRNVPPAGIIGDADILSWRSYDVDIDSQARTLPPGWILLENPLVNGPQTWSRLMRDVSHVGYVYGDPRFPALLGTYRLALDNPRITTRSRR